LVPVGLLCRNLFLSQKHENSAIRNYQVLQSLRKAI
jgi:hypothetical protein